MISNADAEPAMAEGEAAEGCVRILNLSQIRMALGPRWDRLQTKVLDAAEGLLRRSLCEKDAFLRSGDCNFVLVFATLEPRAADVKTLALKRDITQFVMGAEFLTQAERGTPTAAQSAKTQAPKQKPEPLYSDIVAVDETVEAPDRTLTTAEGARAGDGKALDEQELENALSLSPVRETLALFFWPQWDVRRSVVANFYVEPRIALSGATQKIHRGDADGLVARRQDFARDLRVMRRAHAALSALQNLGVKAGFTIPICASSFSTVSMAQAMAQQAATPPHELRRYINYELIERRVGAQARDLDQGLAALRGLSRQIFLQTRADDDRLGRLQSSGFSACGWELLETETGPRAVAGQIRGFRERASAARLPAYLIGAPSLLAVQVAIDAGYAVISGPGVAGASRAPRPPFKLSIDDLISGAKTN